MVLSLGIDYNYFYMMNFNTVYAPAVMFVQLTNLQCKQMGSTIFLKELVVSICHISPCDLNHRISNKIIIIDVQMRIAVCLVFPKVRKRL